MKRNEWLKARKELEKLYIHSQFCENCSSTFGLSFHHLIRRSKGGTNDPSNIVLLCAECHHKADNAPGYEEFNEQLKTLRE